MNVEEREHMLQAIKELNNLDGYDSESNHNDADNILLTFLNEVGYKDLADTYEATRDRICFWYA